MINMIYKAKHGTISHKVARWDIWIDWEASIIAALKSWQSGSFLQNNTIGMYWIMEIKPSHMDLKGWLKQGICTI